MRDTALGINYHRPPTIDARCQDHRGALAATTGSSTAPRTASPTRRSRSCSRSQVERSDGDGVGTLLVPRDAPGLTVRGARRRAPRWYHGACGEVTFKDCRVPAENCLAANGTLASATTAAASPLAQAINLGIGRAAYEAALDYAQLRVQGGRRIIEHQAIGTKLAEIAIQLEVARNAIWKAAWASDHPDASPTAACADLPLDTHRQGIHRGGDPPAPPRMPPNASAPWA